IIQIKSRAANLDTNRQHSCGAPPGEQRFGSAQIGQRGAASLPDQVQRQHIRSKPKQLADITREHRAQITGASADHHRIDLGWLYSRAPQSISSCLRGQAWRIFSETLVQSIRSRAKDLLNRLQREVTARNSIVPQQNLFDYRPRAWSQLMEFLLRLGRFPAFTLQEAFGWQCRP